MSYEGKTVIITGSGAGMGRAAAIQYAAAGANVVVNSVSDSAAGTAEEIQKAGGSALFLKGDVSEPEVAKQMIETTIKTFGTIDVLVNNAGVVYGGSVETIEVETFQKMMKINVESVLLMSKYAIPYMRKNGGGVILNTASVAAVKGLRDRSGYSASKGAVLALTRAMAADHVADHIRVIALNPGTILTPSLRDRINQADDPAAKLAEFEGRQPVGRLGTPEELGAWMVFLTSKEASFVTGGAFTVDGGMTM